MKSWSTGRVSPNQSTYQSEPSNQGLTTMGGKTDEVKGRIKEAAGALTGNEKLRAEGQADQTVAKVKQVGEKVVAKIDQAVKDLKE